MMFGLLSVSSSSYQHLQSDHSCYHWASIESHEGGQGDPLEKWRFCTQGKKVSVLFVNSEQLLLLFSPGAGRHPGFIVEGLHWCYSRLWWWFDTSTQSPQLATPPAQRKWKANDCRKNTKRIVFFTSSGHKNCEWGKVLQEWHHINQ